MLNKKGITLIEVMVVTVGILFTIAIANLQRHKENTKVREQSEEFYEQGLGRYSQEVEIKKNRFITIPNDDHWGGKRIRVDTIRDTNTGKTYIIFRGFDGITALEIK